MEIVWAVILGLLILAVVIMVVVLAIMCVHFAVSEFLERIDDQSNKE